MKKTAIAFAIGQALFVLNAYANETETATPNTANNTDATLEEIIVRGTPFSQQIGTQKINEQQIARMPTTNGNITELLKNNPNVRFSNRSEMSTNGGEIRPDEVSFHGEKFYNNNFMIDGISNNDNLNPGRSASAMADRRPAGQEAYDLPAGDTQSFWLNTHLLKNVEVFDSNISAKYGNFTGGVVNAELKDPDLERDYGSISYRTTRDSWAKFHLQDTQQEGFNRATRLDYQPNYKKHQYGVMLNQRFADNFAVIFGYDRTTSNIGFLHNNLRYTAEPDKLVSDRQTRRAENILLKGIYLPDNGDVWRATLVYSPHQARLLKSNVVNGSYTNTGGGFSGLLQWDKQFESLKMVSSLSYKRSGNEIEQEEDVYRIYRHSPSIGWTSSNATANKGGFGNNKTVKSLFTLKQEFTTSEFDTGALAHKLVFGWQADLAQARFDRDKNIYNYTYSLSSTVACGTANECIDGEQFATQAMLYPIRHVRVNDSTYSAYLEDQMQWNKWQFNLGARLDYNQYLKNLTISPRSSVSYDVFGNQTTHLFGGVSRYYAGSMLAYKLREGIGETVRFNRTEGGTWTYRSNVTQGNTYSVADLKTPYSDEYVLGAAQKVLGGELAFKWVHRNGKDQFTRKQGVSSVHSVLSNDGWSKNNTFTLDFSMKDPYEFKYAKLDWSLGLSYSKGTTNNSYYDASSTEERAEKAIYHNQLIDLDDLPSDDYNARFRARANVNLEFPALRLIWGQSFSYQPKQKIINAVESSRVNCGASTLSSSDRAVCGSFDGYAIPYEDASMGSMFTMDWRFKYTQPLFKQQTLDLTLDVLNVFDKRAVLSSSGSSTSYKMGRNFWLGAQYNF